MIPTLAMNNKHIAYINVDIVIISLQLSLTLLLSTNIQFHMYVTVSVTTRLSPTCYYTVGIRYSFGILVY